MVIPVKAHFDNYVSAWQVDLMTNGEANVLPDGITIFTASAGEAMMVPYMNISVEDKVAQVELGLGQNNTRYIGAIMNVAGYWFAPGMDPDNDDPITYGAPK